MKKQKNDFKNGTNEFYSDFLIGLIGFQASFNGKFFNGYVSDEMNEIRNYQTELRLSIERQINKLKDVKFYFSDYKNLKIPENRFKKVWQKQINSYLNPSRAQKKVECLFIPKNQKIKSIGSLF